VNLIPLIFFASVLVLFWLLIIQPQRRRRALQQQLLLDLHQGDEVMTVGGLFGTVREVGDHDVELEIAPGTQVRLAKSAITARNEREREEEQANSADGSTETPETPLP
jgi:preprotein translocase subunit YajC